MYHTNFSIFFVDYLWESATKMKECAEYAQLLRIYGCDCTQQQSLPVPYKHVNNYVSYL